MKCCKSCCGFLYRSLMLCSITLTLAACGSGGGDPDNAPAQQAQPPAPVALADAATTGDGAAVTIPVLANDTVAAPGVINTASVVIASQSNGTAVVNPDGSVTFTPTAGIAAASTATSSSSRA